MLDNEQMIETNAKIVRLEEKVRYLEDRMTAVEGENRELKGEVKLYQASTGQMNEKLKLIYNALIGDEMGNTGLMKRTTLIENWVAAMDKRKFWLLGALTAAVTLGRLAGTWIEQLLKIIQ